MLSFTKLLSNSAEKLRIRDRIVKGLQKFAPYFMFRARFEKKDGQETHWPGRLFEFHSL